MQKRILGIDEVGRGPYAGPLVIGACILPENRAENPWIEELNDSKKLSERKREKLYDIIKEKAVSATGWVSSKELDEIGMSEALKLATRRAVEKIQKEKVPFNEIIIDGITNFLKGTALEKYVATMKKADFLIKEVSAASIVAKVERDNYMKDLAKKYPGYGFEKHVGYGTAAHQKAMEELGLTPEHRRSFSPVKKLEKTTKEIGDSGEEIIAKLLEEKGHEILARNFKTKFYEIDIVTIKNQIIYFTEVKTRKDSKHGSPKEMVNQKKMSRMAFAAEAYIKYRHLNNDYKLAVGTVEGCGKSDWFILDILS